MLIFTINGSVQFLGILDFFRWWRLQFIPNLQAPTDPTGWGNDVTSNYNWGFIPGGTYINKSVAQGTTIPARTAYMPRSPVNPRAAARCCALLRAVARCCALLRDVSEMTSFVVDVTSVWEFPPQVSILLSILWYIVVAKIGRVRLLNNFYCKILLLVSITFLFSLPLLRVNVFRSLAVSPFASLAFTESDT